MTGEGLEGMFHHVPKHREEMWAGSEIYLVIFFSITEKAEKKKW